MSDSDRDERSPALEWILPTVGIALAIAIAAFLGHLSGQQQERANTAYRYEQSARESATRECVGTEPDRVFECVVEKIETAKQAEHNSKDLTAQQQAAWAGMLNSSLAPFALAATILGLIWIKGTLDATRAAVEETGKATRAMERQNELVAKAQRPWLDFDIEIETGSTVMAYVLGIKVKVINQSNFPAHDVRAGAAGNFYPAGLRGYLFEKVDHRPFIEEYLDNYGEGGAAFPNRPLETRTYAYISDPQKTLEEAHSPPVRLMVGIRYSFEGGVGFTFKEYTVSGARPFADAKDPELAERRGSDGVVPKVAFRVDPSSIIAI